jgi:hypothetical protein
MTLLFVGAAACWFVFAPASLPGRHIGRWASPPKYCGPGSRLAGGNTDAPLMGNGDLGVNLCGEPGSPTWYVGKNDFWSTYNADVTHNMYQSLASVARVQLDLQDLHLTGNGTTSYELAQHLENASVLSTFQAAGPQGARFTTSSVVVASTNVLLTEISSSTAGSVTISLAAGSATGTRRGLPVAAGSAGGDGSIYVARNSSSAAHTHPSAVLRDCRDALLDSFGQQSFVVDAAGRLSLMDGHGGNQSSRCLLLLPDDSAATESATAAPQGMSTSTGTPAWLSFEGHNAMYFPTKTSSIHAIGTFSNATSCQHHIDANATLARLCSIYAWSAGSRSCYCREDAVWEFTAQSGRTSACRPALVRGCAPSPTPHPYRPPHPSPPAPPGPPAPPPCTAANHCARVGSALDLAECAAAGEAAAWHLQSVAGAGGGVHRVVHNSSSLGLLCLTDSGRADPAARCGEPAVSILESVHID